MKNLFYLLLVLGSFTFCQNQSKKTSDYIIPSGDGYYSIANHVADQLILPSYQNYRNSNDSIFLEKILYSYEKNDFFFLIGNIMGSQTSLVLTIKNKEDKSIDVYAEQVGLIDTIEQKTIKDYTFFQLTNSYSDMCSEQESLSIYILNKLKLHKCYEGFKKVEFYNTIDSICQKGNSYSQDFDLKFDNDEIVLIVSKKGIDKKVEERRYSLINYQFK